MQSIRTAEGLKLGILVGEHVGAVVGDGVGAPAAYVGTTKKDNTHFKEREEAKVIRTGRVQTINQTKSRLPDGMAVGIEGLAVGGDDGLAEVGSALGITDGASEEGGTVGT